jgi:hypothetical protein
MKNKWKNSVLLQKNHKKSKNLLKPSLTESLFDIPKRSMISILNSIPPSSPIEKKISSQKIELAHWKEKVHLTNSRDISLSKGLSRHKALTVLESSELLKAKANTKRSRLDVLGSPKQVLKRFQFEEKKNNHKLKERMSLVFSQHLPQSSPNYNSNAEKRLFKGASQREFNQLSELQKKSELAYNINEFDFKKIKKNSKRKNQNLIKVQKEYSKLSFLKSGASSRQGSPRKLIKTKKNSKKGRIKDIKTTGSKSSNRLPIKYRSKKSILVSNKKKSKEDMNKSTKTSGYRSKVNLGLLENVYNRSTKLIQSPNLYNDKFSNEKSIQKKKRKSHGLNKMIMEFQQNFLNKKRNKQGLNKNNLNKLVKNFTSSKSKKNSLFNKRRSFTQKLSDTMNLLKKSNKTYNNGLKGHIKKVNITEFKELQNVLLSKASQKNQINKLIEFEGQTKSYKSKKNKRKSLTMTSWYKTGKKLKTLKRYSKKLLKSKTQKQPKKHSLKSREKDSGDSGISFGEKDTKLNMAKSETVPGFIVNNVNFQSSSDNKSSFSKITRSKKDDHEVKSLVPDSRPLISEFPFSKNSQKNIDSKCLPSIYMRSQSELEQNDSNSIFSPKIDKDFVLSKEDNSCLIKIDAFQNNYNFNSNPNYSSHVNPRSGISLKHMEAKSKIKKNIYDMNSIEKLKSHAEQIEMGKPTTYSNYSNYLVKKKKNHFDHEDMPFKSKMKINSSNNLGNIKSHDEIPSFQPIRNRSFMIRQKQMRDQQGCKTRTNAKKNATKKLNKIKKTFEFNADVSIRSQKTTKNTDRNREGCKFFFN